MDRMKLDIGKAILQQDIVSKKEHLESRKEWMLSKMNGDMEFSGRNFHSIAFLALECRDLVRDIEALERQSAMLDQIIKG